MMRNFINENMERRVFLCVLFLLYITRYILSGFKYYPILDDHIQYFWYANAYSDVRDVFFSIGTLATRPAAGFFDIFVWSKLYTMRGAVILLGAVISFFGVHFFARSLEDMGVRVGALFYVILLFLPINTEAQYWLSASSRIMVAMAVCALSMRVFAAYNKRRSTAYLICFSLLELFSMCFYEQVAIFSFIFCIAYFYRTNQSGKIYIIPIINVCVVGAYYIVFKNVGAFSGRFKIILPQEIISHLVFMSKELYNVVIEGIFSLSINAFVRGCILLKQTPLLFFVVAILSFAAVLVYAQPQKEIYKNKKDSFTFWFGAAIFIFSLAPMLVMSGAALPYRTVYLPIIGISLMASYLIKRMRSYIRYEKPAMFFILFILSVACISEINDYKNTSVIDRQICESIIESLDDSVLSGERECYLVGAKKTYISLNAEHGEHILSVTSSDWALTGAVRRYAGRYIKRIIPTEKLTDEILSTSSQILEISDDLKVNVIRK